MGNIKNRTIAKSQSTRQKNTTTEGIRTNYVIPFCSSNFGKSFIWSPVFTRVTDNVHLTLYTVSFSLKFHHSSCLQRSYRFSSNKIRKFFLSLLHFETWTPNSVEWCPRTIIVKLRYETWGWRRQYSGVYDIDSPPSRSFCCRNIAKLPLFRSIWTHPCPLPVLCPEESMPHSSCNSHNQAAISSFTTSVSFTNKTDQYLSAYITRLKFTKWF